MKTCLVLGGASTLEADIASYDGPVDGVVACNEAGYAWPGILDGWASLHPEYFIQKGWVAERKARGYPEARAYYGIPEAVSRRSFAAVASFVTLRPFHDDGQFPGRSASSGIYAVKVALVDLKFDRVVMAGIPLDPVPHFWDEGKAPWIFAPNYRERCSEIAPAMKERIRSCSGWTRSYFGGPGEPAPTLFQEETVNAYHQEHQ